MTKSSVAHELLRSATAADHARVDASFANGLRDAASYQRYLLGMHALLGALAKSDPVLAADYAVHRARLTEDLDALGLASPDSQALPFIANEPARLGARYVIEGSALGARLLQRQAHALGHTQSQGAGFLAYHVDRGITHWPRLMQALAQHDPASPGFQTTLTAARDTFAFAATCFNLMGPAAKDWDEGQNCD